MNLQSVRSDPTENDSVEGLRPNARGPGLVTFGVSGLCFFCFIQFTFELISRLFPSSISISSGFVTY